MGSGNKTDTVIDTLSTEPHSTHSLKHTLLDLEVCARLRVLRSGRGSLRNELGQLSRTSPPATVSCSHYLPSPFYFSVRLTPHPRSGSRAPRLLGRRKFPPTCAATSRGRLVTSGLRAGRRLLGARFSRPCGPGLPFKRAGPAPTAPHRGDREAQLLSLSIFNSPSGRISNQSCRRPLLAESSEQGHAARSTSRPPGSGAGGR